MGALYHNLPQALDPVAFALGPFAVRYYALMWLLAFALSGALLLWRVRHAEARALGGLTPALLTDMATAALVGALVGGRIGYAVFYEPAFFAAHPLALVWPFADGQFVGIRGMSFHGGVLGVALALWLFARRRGWQFFALTDFVVPAVPLGYALGRVGNFLNGELWGRVTERTWGMFFATAPDGGTLLRHPSQLYEAFLEGVVLFAVLWCVRKRLAHRRGALTGLFLIGYSVARFVSEFFRAPDAQLGLLALGLSMGQWLSLGMALAGCLVLASCAGPVGWWRNFRHRA